MTFSIFINNTFADKAKFNGAVFMNDATFATSRFEDESDFQESNFTKDLDLSDTSFFRYADFRGAFFNGSANLNSAEFQDDSDFRGAHFGGTLDLSESLFLADLSLLDAVFHENSSLILNNARVLGNVYLRWAQIHDGSLFRNSRLVYSDVAFLFLIQNYKSLGWIRDANDCYLEYRREARQVLPAIYKIPDIILWAFYGYGVKPEWSLFWSSVILILCALFYWRIDGKGFGKAFEFSASVFLSGTGKLLIAAPEYSPKNRVRLANFVFLAERLIGGFLIVLFFMAVSKTVAT